MYFARAVNAFGRISGHRLMSRDKAAADKAEKRLQAILDTTVDGIITMGADCRIQTFI